MPYDIIIGRNEADKKVFGKRGVIYIGKSYVKMGQYTSLSNRILLDIARNHVILVAGKRGSGKSYTLGVIAEGLSTLKDEDARQNIGSLIFDTMGIYWTMKYPNEKDRDLLQQWDLKPQKVPVKIFVPFGHYQEYIDKGIPIDEGFALDVTELKAEDWIMTFGLEIVDPVSVLVQRSLKKLEGLDFDLDDIISTIEKDETSTIENKNAATALFEVADTWGIFAGKKHDLSEGTKVKDLINAGETTVLDLSVYNSVGAFNIRALAISLLSRKIFEERMAARKKEEVSSVSEGLDYAPQDMVRDNPLVWIFIDEAHEFLPLTGKTIASDALIQLLREGRQPGISLVLATQQPGQIHRDVMTQSDIVISHRVTAKPDLDALNFIMQSYVLESINQQMDDLPTLKGSAIILDDDSERIYPGQIRPRFTWHGGADPTSIVAEREF